MAKTTKTKSFWKVFLFILGMIVAAGIVWWFVQGDRSASVSTYVGLALSFLGLFVAIAIFMRQSVVTERNHESLQRWVNRLHIPKEQEKDVSGNDWYAKESEFAKKVGKISKDGFIVLTHENVPLRIVHDLVEGWKNAGNAGQWPLSTVRAAVRQEGRGNHSWFVVTNDPDTGETRNWRVSRGGQGKDAVTVTEFPVGQRSDPS